MDKVVTRIAFLKAQYVPAITEMVRHGYVWSELDHMIEDPVNKANFICDQILAADPDPVGHRYSSKLLEWFVKEELDRPDMLAAAEDIRFFLSRRYHPQFYASPDIGRYARSADLASVLTYFRMKFVPKAYFMECDEKFLASAGGNGQVSVLYADSEHRLLQIHSEEASKAYTRNMRSCVAYTHQENHFKDYEDDLLLLQSAKGNRWLISFSHAQLRDENDDGENVDLGSLLQNHLRLSEILGEHLIQGHLKALAGMAGDTPLAFNFMDRNHSLALTNQVWKSAIAEIVPGIMTEWCDTLKDHLLCLERFAQVGEWAEAVPVDSVRKALDLALEETFSDKTCLEETIITLRSHLIWDQVINDWRREKLGTVVRLPFKPRLV